MLRRHFLSSTLILLVTLVAPEAKARRRRLRFLPGRIRGTGRKTYSSDVLNQDELEKCLRMTKNVDDQNDRVPMSSTGIEAEKEQLQVLQQTLEVKRATLNNYSEFEVDEFNRSIEKYEKMRENFNSNVDRHNQFVSELNNHISQFNLSCANKQYYVDDMSAAKAATGINPD